MRQNGFTSSEDLLFYRLLQDLISLTQLAETRQRASRAKFPHGGGM